MWNSFPLDQKEPLQRESSQGLKAQQRYDTEVEVVSLTEEKSGFPWSYSDEPLRILGERLCVLPVTLIGYSQRKLNYLRCLAPK